MLTVTNDVLIGADGELFLAGGGHQILKVATGEVRPSTDSVNNFLANVMSRRKKAKAAGCPYMHLIAPEKFRVYDEAFPVEDARCYFDYYRAVSPADVVYPAEQLKHNMHGRSYFRTDTHWTWAGMLRIGEIMLEKAGVSPELIEKASGHMMAAVTTVDEDFAGDLGRKLEPKQSEMTRRPKWPARTIRIENGIEHNFTASVNDGRIVCCRNPESLLDSTLLIFGDSYLYNALPILSTLYRNIVFLRTRFWHDEVVTMVRPDMIVTQAAERYLSKVANDDVAPPYLLLPYVLGRSPKMEPAEAALLASFFSGGRKIDFSVYGLDL
ncbi:hypothetical protein [Asticcacaulis sp.]|uniref:hypothetical protein n=1 Tax=Asticcacaulis sp. TaxID=1872648 RepID=UPI003F7C3D7E